MQADFINQKQKTHFQSQHHYRSSFNPIQLNADFQNRTPFKTSDDSDEWSNNHYLKHPKLRSFICKEYSPISSDLNQKVFPGKCKFNSSKKDADIINY